MQNNIFILILKKSNSNAMPTCYKIKMKFLTQVQPNTCVRQDSHILGYNKVDRPAECNMQDK